MKLRIVPARTHREYLMIVDEAGRVVATMRFEDLRLAERIVRRENGWWHTLFGGKRDQAQRAYDRWASAR